MEEREEEEEKDEEERKKRRRKRREKGRACSWRRQAHSIFPKWRLCAPNSGSRSERRSPNLVRDDSNRWCPRWPLIPTAEFSKNSTTAERQPSAEYAYRANSISFTGRTLNGAIVL